MAPAPKFSPVEQEELILNAAADCIWETSLTDFTMAAVSRASCLSMGSIYKHVQCKEDIIFALAMRSFKYKTEVFERVINLDLTTPEKTAGIALLSPEKISVYPFDCQLEAMVTNEAIIKRASPLWTERMFNAHQGCEILFNKCLHKAAFSGELSFQGNTNKNIEEINLAIWAVIVGFVQVNRVLQLKEIAAGTDSLQQAPKVDSVEIKTIQRLINSFNWQQPLTDEGIVKVANLLESLELR